MPGREDASVDEEDEVKLQGFEQGAQLWRLDAVRLAQSVSEEAAFGPTDPALHTEMLVALDGIEMEISRFERFGASRRGSDLQVLVRLAEVAVALQSARIRLRGIMENV